MKPFALLAFALDKERELKALENERVGLTKVLSDAKWTPCPVWPFRDDLFMSQINNNRNEIRIFHFGGHAFPGGVQSNPSNPLLQIPGQQPPPNVLDGALLAKYLKTLQNLKLVFLNGCSTSEMAKEFLDIADAVISTRFPVNDYYAMQLAHSFYTHFFQPGDLGLRAAFNQTVTWFASAAQQTSWSSLLDKSVQEFLDRGGSRVIPQPPIEQLYELSTRNDEVDRAIAATWYPPAPALVEADAGTASSNRKQVSADCYLLCDRTRENERLTQTILDKRTFQSAKVVFCFIHDEERHCPLELFERFVSYTFPEDLNEVAPSPEVIELPYEADLADLERCKQAIIEKYARKFYSSDPQTKKWKLRLRVPDDKFIFIHHPLEFSAWDDRWEEFFNWYFRQGSQKLAQTFSGRLVVFLTRETQDGDEAFQAYLKDQTEKTDLKSFLLNFTGLDPIRPFDFIRWQTKVFGSKILTTEALFGDEKELDFFTAKPKLKSYL